MVGKQACLFPTPIAATPHDWQNLIGIQYGLNGKPATLNCYGLVREVYKGLQIELPARDIETLNDAVIAEEDRNWERIDEPPALCRGPDENALRQLSPGNRHA